MKNWKSLQRHPLSAEYRDITGTKWESLKSAMQSLGFLGTFPIVVHEEQVIDGWQRHRACIELDIKPTFTTLPNGIEPEDYVKIVNDERRHETREEAESRIEARRRRVLASRDAGKSYREIAEEEGISVGTAHDDAKTLEIPPSGVQPRTPDHGNYAASNDEKTEKPAAPPKNPEETPKTTGKDGKTYNAKKPILCERCQRVGPTKDCPACKEARSEAKRKPKPAEPDTEPEPPKVPCDKNGVPWESKAPKALIAIKAEPQFYEMARQLSKMAKTIADDESLSLYTYSMQSVVAAIKNVRSTLLDALPAYICPYCDGTLKTVEGAQQGKACEVCNRQGWVAKSTYRRSPKGYSPK